MSLSRQHACLQNTYFMKVWVKNAKEESRLIDMESHTEPASLYNKVRKILASQATTFKLFHGSAVMSESEPLALTIAPYDAVRIIGLTDVLVRFKAEEQAKPDMRDQNNDEILSLPMPAKAEVESANLQGANLAQAFKNALKQEPRAEVGQQEGSVSSGQQVQLSALRAQLQVNSTLYLMRRLYAHDRDTVQKYLRNLQEWNSDVYHVITGNRPLFQQWLDQPQDDQFDTTDQMQAIERLCELGFGRNAASMAYLLTEQNQEQAANVLLNNQIGDDLRIPPDPSDEEYS